MHTVCAKMGTTDFLLGLQAAISQELRVRSGGQRSSFPIGRLHNVLAQLRERTEYAEELQWLDFTRTGNNWYSQALDHHLFIGGAYCLHRLEENGASFSVRENLVTSRFKRLEERFGPAAVEKIRQMAKNLLDLPQA